MVIGAETKETPESKFRGIAYSKRSTMQARKKHAKKTPEQHQFSSLIRTVTVGSGISPDQPQHFCKYQGSRTFTAGGEFRPAPKNHHIFVFST